MGPFQQAVQHAAPPPSAIAPAVVPPTFANVITTPSLVSQPAIPTSVITQPTVIPPGAPRAASQAVAAIPVIQQNVIQPPATQPMVQPPSVIVPPVLANRDPHPNGPLLVQQPVAQQPVVQGAPQPNQAPQEANVEEAAPFPPIPPPQQLLVLPEQLDRFGYLKNHHSTWTASNLLTEKDSLLQKIRRFSTEHESQNYKSLLAELARLYLDLIGYVNALNSSSEANVVDSARRVIRESEARIDEIRAVIKNSMLILNRGNDFRQILPGPSSCDYNAEDKSRIRESEQFIRSKGEARKQRGAKRPKKGGFHPYRSRETYRPSAPVGGNMPGANRPPGFFTGPQGPPSGSGGQGPNVTCFYCGKQGHVRSKCLKRIFDGVP